VVLAIPQPAFGQSGRRNPLLEASAGGACPVLLWGRQPLTTHNVYNEEEVPQLSHRRRQRGQSPDRPAAEIRARSADAGRHFLIQKKPK
jgi:hypothetical protein